MRRLIAHPLSIASVNYLAVCRDVIQQLSLVEFYSPAGQQEAKVQSFRLDKLIALDPVEADRRLGVCSVPLYELTGPDAEVFQSGRDVEAAREILRRYGILQYFFPSADQLALGFADRQSISPSHIVDNLLRTPETGHPFGELEIVAPETRLNDMVEALQSRGLLVEGEYGVEITATGREVRAQVRFKPRESIFARLAHVFSVKLDVGLKDLFNR